MPLQPTNDPQGPVAVYLLERGIPFRLVRHTKTVRTKDLPQVRSVALEQVLKNLLFIDSAGEPLLCILGCDREIDTSKLRDLVGREVRLAEADEVLRHTGSPIGNVPSVVPGLRKFLDATVTELELVSICSCLDNDAGINLRPGDLLRALDNCQVVRISPTIRPGVSEDQVRDLAKYHRIS